MKSQGKKIVPSPLTLAAGRALRRAAKVARKTARVHGTPIYILKNGKIKVFLMRLFGEIGIAVVFTSSPPAPLQKGEGSWRSSSLCFSRNAEPINCI